MNIMQKAACTAAGDDRTNYTSTPDAVGRQAGEINGNAAIVAKCCTTSHFSKHANHHILITLFFVSETKMDGKRR